MRLVMLLLSTLILWAADAAKYVGTWQSANSGSNGKLQMTLGENAAGSTASFSISGQDVPCTVRSLDRDGDSIEFVITYEMEGGRAASTLKGKRKEKELSGEYTSKRDDGEVIDQGTFRVMLAQ